MVDCQHRPYEITCERPAEFFIEALWGSGNAEVCAGHLATALTAALRHRPEVKVSRISLDAATGRGPAKIGGG